MTARVFCYVSVPSEKDTLSHQKELINRIVIPTLDPDSAYQLCSFEEDEYEYPLPEEIRKKILKSKFCIVDMMQEDAGIYYQVGYADGIGKPVIFLYKQSEDDCDQPVDVQIVHNLLFL